MLKWLIALSLFGYSVEDIVEKQIRVFPAILLLLGTVVYHFLILDIPMYILVKGLFVGICIAVISVCSKGNIGMGDALLFGLIGSVMGLYTTIQIAILSFTMCGFFSAFLFLIKKKEKTYRIPFVPFLLIGYCLSM